MLNLLLGLMIIPFILPAFSLLALTIAALGVRGRPNRAPISGKDRPRVAALIPAHNESSHVLSTIACLHAQLGPRDRLVVIADNCADDTAAQARTAGAEVIERHDPDRRGKGYALAFGVDHLRADPPEVVLIIDADCLLSVDAVAMIAEECRQTARPAQMLDLMSAGPDASLKLRVLEFAMRVKNLVRPLGMFRLGRACHLMGTGMAFPWPLIASAELATGHIAEDMKLGVALTQAGHAPRFLVDAQVTSAFVLDAGVAKTQKSRWEHGHLATMLEELTGLLRSALRTRDPALTVLAMDLLIPPVAFYTLLLGALLATTLLAAWLWPMFNLMAIMAIGGALCFTLAIGLAWFYFGRDLLNLRELLSTPLYALWKLPVYLAFFLKKRSGWVRTRRNAE